MKIPHTGAGGPVARGAALLEFALCLPVMLVLVVGALECTSMVFLQQSLKIVTYEGARTATRPQALDADVAARCQQVIAERGLVDCQITTLPESVESLPPGTEVLVRATAPPPANSPLPLRHFGGLLQAEAVMVKE